MPKNEDGGLLDTERELVKQKYKDFMVETVTALIVRRQNTFIDAVLAKLHNDEYVFTLSRHTPADAVRLLIADVASV